jgi:hypothetical protein
VGTLRDVKVYRNDKPIATYDVYDFILNGNVDTSIRLEDNDVVSVDAYKNLVCVTGKVKRPMYYEMLDDETVAQLLKYAGGFSGNAYKEDIRLVRNGKREREIYTLNAEEQQTFIVGDGECGFAFTYRVNFIGFCIIGCNVFIRGCDAYDRTGVNF